MVVNISQYQHEHQRTIYCTVHPSLPSGQLHELSGLSLKLSAFRIQESVAIRTKFRSQRIRGCSIQCSLKTMHQSMN